jgi:3-hydroxyacyl-[acyl-carrier-protein] dehydratase
MDRKMQLQAPLDHPSYAGHFPGNPIVPGVVLLDLIVEALGYGSPRVIGNVKFHRALKPAEHFTLRHRLTGAQLSFRCSSGDQLLVEGSLSFAAPPEGAPV